MDFSEKMFNAAEIFDSIADPQYINGEATEEITKILRCGGNIDSIVSTPDNNFHNVVSAFNNLCNSEEINHTSLYKHKDIVSTGAPNICLQIRPDIGAYEKYFVMVIFSKIILLFLVSNNAPEFLFALNSNALKIHAYTKEKIVPVVIEEKTKNELSYYDKYNPYSDSKIIRSYWERTNLDGSRSFAGGLKPENNPLNYVLEYGLIELKLCNATLETAFSCASNVLEFCKFAQIYLKKYKCSTNINMIINTQCIERAKAIVTRNKYRQTPTAFLPFVASIAVIVFFGILICLIGMIITACLT